MMCVCFFLCLCTAYIVEIILQSISNFEGGFRCKNEYPWCIIEVKSKHFPTVFKKIGKTKNKMTEKREFLRKTSFRLNQFCFMVVIQKLITVKT
ncbi:Uncharacterized protein FWK35_00020499 [Aphis craccivora]|uniref:Secreted protein n=1 Tax=Aphis craccivora TaxID=307492 RepID=A0A6G0Z0V7_APHCR|nr:Uncharacterized protein FWK35_00020499 [Aphis craccivora]